MSRPYSYASAPDVSARIGVATITASSKPNTTQVAGYIDDISDELDGRLAALNYTTPIPTGATTAFDLLNAWTSIGAAMNWTAALPQGESGKHLPYLERRWNTILKALEDGTMAVPGLSKDTTTGRVRFGVGGGTSSATPYFVRDPLDY